MSKRIAFIGLTLISGLTTLTSFGQTSTKANVNGQTGTDFVTTAVPFLRISPDARAGAMGDASIAVSPDANAQYWDVAKIPFSDKKYGVSATYTPWLKDLVPDIFLAYIAGYAKFGENDDQAISASMRYFSLGNISYTDFNANPIGTGMPREYSFDAGYSRRLSPYLGVGVTMRYIHSAIASGVSAQPGTDYKPGNTLAADLGVFYTRTKDIDGIKSRTFSFGAVASNIGGKISYNNTRKDFIPMNLGVGIAYTSKFDEYNAITFALDVNKLLVPALNSADTQVSVVSGILGSFTDAPGGFSGEMKQIDVSLGAEYWYQNQFALRAGYFYENPDNGDRQYFTTGIGVKYNVFQLNASYLIPSGSGISRNPLSNTLRFSLLFAFDKLEKSADAGSSE
ncbi:MAG: type IX secretion system outer membrane channel protein PorV [Flavipsychrobacter sp.]|nr:type IX secretion system outer membrane channel protein PorV [Flavipsychrobacter sp.]